MIPSWGNTEHNEIHHFSMADIDECLTGDHFCNGSTTCSNEVGGYRCICDNTNNNGRIHSHAFAIKV